MHSSSNNKSGMSVARLVSVLVLFCIVLGLFVMRLLYLQTDDSEQYENIVSTKNYKAGVLTAQRGEIYDRKGKKLVSNVITYNLEINRTTLENGASVDILANLIKLLNEYSVEIQDYCPLTQNSPYQLDPDYIFDKSLVRGFEKFLSLHNLEKSDVTGTDFYDYMLDRYGIPDDIAQTELGRKIAAIRYDMEVNDFSTLNPYTLLYDIDDELRTAVSERKHEFHGIEIVKDYSRKYNLNSTLCHILGRIGTIYAEEAEEYINEKGYSYDALIGKDGIEKIYEEYLRGIDGSASYEIDENNDIVGYTVTNEPKEGYSVRITVDSELQQIVEKAIEKEINIARSSSYLYGGVRTGEDCYKGAAVVMDVNSAEVLAMASFPGYDLNTFSADFNEIRSDPREPLVNRATQGIYPPGSTFKILTAAAALDTGTINAGTYILDKGEYRKYAPTYTPRCWVYLRNGGTHGYVNVIEALKVSCNYYFYSVADMMGIDTIVDYATDFGLGTKTGIELPEAKGILASPAYRESIGYVWNPGDTLQMAIGQSDNAFTPIQLALYMSTVVNGGNRYKATILKSVDEYYTGKPVIENKPQVLNKTNLSNETVNTIKNAMRSVVDEAGGTATTVFAGKSYQRDIGGKTGTAQVSGGSDTVLFVGFAPYDNPEIAVAVVIENGYKSARASSVAAAVFDWYFGEKTK